MNTYRASSLLLATIFLISSIAISANHDDELTDTHDKSSGHVLQHALDAQDDAVKARYGSRHPKETLEFFGIKPGMKIAEPLPGGGWYTKILLPYLGKSGHLVGVDYSYKMHAQRSSNAAFLKKKETWAADWLTSAEPWRTESSASLSATTFGTMPAELDNSLDAILYFRAIHHLTRFEDKGGYFTEAIADSFRVLKSGGIVGIVQHQAREDRPDAWANGDNGYVKKSYVVDAMEAAGFEFVGESDINENTKDLAKEGDKVWRLPPTLGVDDTNEALVKEMSEIGESNRMTLKFRKP